MKKLILSICLLLSISLMAQNAPTVRMYPNPATNFVRFSFYELIQSDITITVSDILGNKIETFTYKGSESIYLDLSGLNLINGMYLIKIEAANALYLNRLIIKNN